MQKRLNAENRPKVKEAATSISLYRDLHEDFFKNKKALQLCQLDHLSGGFIEKSTIQEDGHFMAYVNAPQRRSKGVIEFILWKYLKKLQDTNADEMYIATHVIGGLELPLEVNEELKAIENLKQEDQIMNLAEEDEDIGTAMASAKDNKGLFSPEDLAKMKV